MDLARYCVNAVLVEGRSVRAVAAATGRSKSWVAAPRRSLPDGGRRGSDAAEARTPGAGQPHPRLPSRTTSSPGASDWAKTDSTPGPGPSTGT